MILSLIGMSNVGKSYWSKRLETEKGFQRFCCDDMIQERLGVDDLSAWMGMPYSADFTERENRYLEIEADVLAFIIDEIGRHDRVVIDTTGSVIYLDPEILNRLSTMSRVVYLRTTDQDLADMIETFFACPKPVVWGECYSCSVDEHPEQALRRCYPSLLDHRASRYHELAHVSVSRQRLRSPDYSIDDFLYDVSQHEQQAPSCLTS